MHARSSKVRHDDKGAFEAMSGATADPRLIGARAAPRKALRLSWSDPIFRAIFWQVVIIGIVVLVVWYLIGNTSRNLAARHIATGFAFLGRVAGIPIGESPIAYNPAVDTYGTALIIGSEWRQSASCSRPSLVR